MPGCATLSPSPWGCWVPRCWHRAPVTSQRGGWSCQRAPGEGTALGGHIQSKRRAPSPAGTPRRKAPRRAGTSRPCHPWVQGTTWGQLCCGSTAQDRGNGHSNLQARQARGFKHLFFCRQDFPWQLRGPARPPAPCGALGVTAARPPRTSVPFPHLGFPISVSTGGRDAGGPLLGEATRELWHAAVPHGDSGFFQTGSQGH